MLSPRNRTAQSERADEIQKVREYFCEGNLLLAALLLERAGWKMSRSRSAIFLRVPVGLSFIKNRKATESRRQVAFVCVACSWACCVVEPCVALHKRPHTTQAQIPNLPVGCGLWAVGVGNWGFFCSVPQGFVVLVLVLGVFCARFPPREASHQIFLWPVRLDSACRFGYFWP